MITKDSKVSELMSLSPFRLSEDKKGHSIVLGAKAPSWLEREVTKLVESRAAPYEVKSDVIRDAIWLGLQVLKLRYTQTRFGARVALVELKQNLEDRETTQEEDKDFLNKLNELWQIDKAKAHSLLRDYYEALKSSDDAEDAQRVKHLLENSLVKNVMAEALPEVLANATTK